MQDFPLRGPCSRTQRAHKAARWPRWGLDPGGWLGLSACFMLFLSVFAEETWVSSVKCSEDTVLPHVNGSRPCLRTALGVSLSPSQDPRLPGSDR